MSTIEANQAPADDAKTPAVPAVSTPPAETRDQEARGALAPALETPLSMMLDSAARCGDLQKVMQIAKILADTDMVPKSYRRKPEAIVVAYDLGASVGMPLMASLQNIQEINGKPALYGDGIAAVVKRNGGRLVERPLIDENTGEITGYECEAHRHGHPVVVQQFTVEDAQKARLWKKDGPWTNYPTRMLQMRARGFACRDQYPDWLSGMTPAEEAFDFIEIDDEGSVSTGTRQGQVRGGNAGRCTAAVLNTAQRRQSGQKDTPAAAPAQSKAPREKRDTSNGAEFTAQELALQIAKSSTIDAINDAMANITDHRPHLANEDYSRLMREARDQVKSISASGS